MKIETLMNAHRMASTPAVESLESRLLQAAANKTTTHIDTPANPGFEGVYRRLLNMKGQGAKALYAFLRTLPGEDRSTAMYPTAQALMAVTQQLLVRLKDDELADSPLYREVKSANGLAFNMTLFVVDHAREVFRPLDDEALEKNQW